ncbi:hypothetical protein C4552_01035 [Candidatus Parcubacteria bacterium]|nr:MAG: hypothetical protein C4552_01035 [Candidatus Parcubacteria bacterium]
MARAIGILHRTKKTAQGEARPTMVAIKENGAVRELKLETEVEELDFVFGIFPTAWREIAENEDRKQFQPHHVRAEKKRGGKRDETVVKVPASYDGLQPGDTVMMYLGGSGDRLAFSLSKRADLVGASVWRTPPFLLAAATPEEKKTAHLRLIEFYERSPQSFYRVMQRDREFIRVMETYRDFKAAQKDRIACDQRLRQRGIGATFLSEEGLYPEGKIEDEFDAVRANSAALAANIKDEANLQARLVKLVRKLDLWLGALEDVEGCGEVLSAAIITGVGNIRRFRSFQDTREIERLRAEIIRLETVGKRNDDADKIEEVSGDNHFIRTGRIARWKREHGKLAEANALQRALELMQEVSKVQNRYQSRLKAYGGVHVVGLDGKKMPPGTVRTPGDGMFPRKRRGVVANWSPQLRQALYLFGDQCVKRPESLWGQKYRAVKRELRARHPVVECSICRVPWEQCTKRTLGEEALPANGAPAEEQFEETAARNRHTRRYTDGHIHKMAVWRTITLFLVWFAGEWMRIEEERMATA